MIILMLIMIKAKCPRCRYEWETHSKLIKVSCPSCGNKVVINSMPDFREKNE